jgi:hypothetical protein
MGSTIYPMKEARYINYQFVQRFDELIAEGQDLC